MQVTSEMSSDPGTYLVGVGRGMSGEVVEKSRFSIAPKRLVEFWVT